MKKSIKNILLIFLIIFLSACSSINNNLGTVSKIKINNNLPVISSQSIRNIPDVASIALEWKGYATSNIKGYYIFRSDFEKDGNKLTRIAKVKSKFASHYLDTNLKPNTQYLYSISTIGTNGSQSKLSKPIKTATLQNFDSISFSIAISNLPRIVKILWRPHTNKAVKYYIIQRNDNKSQKWKTIGKIKHRLNAEYIDKNLKDNYTYMYRIQAVTFDGIKSKYSQIISATTKRLPKTTSQIDATTNIARKIIISWKKINDDNIVAYNIYSSRSKNGYYTKIANVNKFQNTITDNLNENGITRYYKITTIDKDNLETNKNKLPIVMGKTLEVPKTPKIVDASIRDNAIIINWSKTDNRAIYYNMHKTIKESFFKSKSILFKHINGTSFIDKDITRGIDYIYHLEAVDANGLLSKKTKGITLSMPRIKTK